MVKQAGNYAPDDAVFYYGTRNGLVDQLAVDLDSDGNEEVLAVNEANDRLKIFTGDNLDRLNRQTDCSRPRATSCYDGGSERRRSTRDHHRQSRGSIDLRLPWFTRSGFTSSEILVGSAPNRCVTRDVNGDGHTDVLVLDDAATQSGFLV